jgi:hypothetical protein
LELADSDVSAAARSIRENVIAEPHDL